MHFTTAVIVKKENLYADAMDSVMTVLSPAFDYGYLDCFDVEEEYTVKYVCNHLEEIKDRIDAYAAEGVWNEESRNDMLKAFEQAIQESNFCGKVYIVNCHR